MICNEDKKGDTPKILLAIPLYNEEKHINAILNEVSKYIDDVLVVDDGSTDGSKLILAKRKNIYVISYPCNRGYGQTIINAFDFAIGSGYDWIITIDCDLQHEPAQIPHFIDVIKKDHNDIIYGSDIISGSRYLQSSPKSGDGPPEDRRKINKEITRLVNEKLNLPITDAFCGFKAHRVKSVQKMRLGEVGYAVPLEFWVQCAAMRLRVKEIPVSLIYNDPNRHFGGELDDPDTRLNHYLDVFEKTLIKAGLKKQA